MIDACITRTLKQVARERTGDFIDNTGASLTSVLLLDELGKLVRGILERKTLLTLVLSEEVAERCDWLVSKGCIEMVEGINSPVSLRSIGYCYLLDI